MKNSKAKEISKKQADENKKETITPASRPKQSREEHDAVVNNTGVMPGENQKSKAGTDSDAASG